MLELRAENHIGKRMNTLEWKFLVLLKHFSTCLPHANEIQSDKVGKSHYGMYKKYCMSIQAKVSLIPLVFQSKLIAEHEAEEEQWKGLDFTNVNLLDGIYA